MMPDQLYQRLQIIRLEKPSVSAITHLTNSSIFVKISLDFGNSTKPLNINMLKKDPWIKRKILRTIDPTLNLNIIRQKAYKDSNLILTQILTSMRDEEKSALSKADTAALIAKAQSKASSLARRHRIKLNKIRYNSGIKTLKELLTGDLADLSIEEFSSIWEQCQISNVLKA